ncbi:MAG TPA: DMT family transporter [Acidimicrobiales bacterium]|nr:DMT family transporter [Acidimicrobiales bacterium]
MLTATFAALFAAALFAVSTALQHRSAGLVTEADIVRTASLGGFISGTLRHPLWIVGSAAGIVGFALHALALRDGPLTLVQPLLVSSAVFALALRQLLERRRPRRSELGWAFGLVVGLVLFLTIATPANGVAKPADALPTLIIGALIGLGALGFFAAGRRSNGSGAAAFLGTATGLSFAAKAGLLKQVMGALNGGPGALARAWPVYIFIAVWLCGLLLNQLAYQAGPLHSSLPAIMTVDPVVSLVIGVAIFDEQFRKSPADLAGEAFGLALVVAAAVGLTRSVPGRTDDGPAAPAEHRATAMTGSSPSESLVAVAQVHKRRTKAITRSGE